ncbi:hypothetical protein SCUP515_12254 [Seiridium cupressi]|uniref:Dehydrin n=2 Tax=Seiridium TaxID=138063 RepID=A0ABR2UK94_9PEZI
MSTGGGSGYAPGDYNKNDKSMIDKLKDVVKPSKDKHSSSGPTATHPSTGEGEAYRSRPQEGIQQTQHQDTMPGGTGMRHQGQDTSGGITDALKPGTGASGHSSTGQAAREMTDSMGSSMPRTSKKFQGGLGSDPGSAAQGGI